MSSSKIRIGFVQINNSFSGQNYLPYTAGLLQAYALSHANHPEDLEFLSPIYSRIPVDRAVLQMRLADVVCFSVYVWNIRLSLEIAEKLKAQNRDVLIVFGGPQVPDRSESFLRRHSFIDLVCNGEGEQCFVSILNHLRSRNWRRVPSIAAILKDGAFLQTERVPRLKDLGELPSPYLAGVFDPLLLENPGRPWLVLWETNRGCPFSCTFCDWGSAVSSKVFTFPMDRLERDMEWFSEKKIEFIYCCDANFGILPRDLDIVKAMAALKARTGYPKAFSVQNTKNSTDRSYRIQRALNEAQLNKGVTLSMQSIDPNTLKQVKRENISLKTYRDLQFRFRADGVHTYTDLILGMPGETYETFVDGVSTIIQDGQHNRIQFNNLSILPNAEMGDPAYQKKHGFEVVETKIINIHGSLADDEEISETQHLVVATNSMGRQDWVRSRAFAFETAFLHFDKLLQIPMVLLNTLAGVSYREMIERLSAADPAGFPILASIHSFFVDKALDIQAGGPEYCHSRPWLNIWWPADEYMLIRLCVEDRLPGFYEEVERNFSAFLSDRGIEFHPELLREAVTLNHQLLKMPFQTEDVILPLSFNIWEYYQCALRGQGSRLDYGPRELRIDRISETWSSWDDWYKEVIWYENKKGSYLYRCFPVLENSRAERI